MNKKHFLNVVIICISILALTGCFGGVKDQLGEMPNSELDNREIPVEAYLFDVKVRRKGKPTSIRLDLYQTDSAVAMYGRGYFNKGAFWGKFTRDSIQLYFPTTQEYLDESVENLFLSFDCESKLIGLDLLSYFMNLPDTEKVSANLKIDELVNKDDERELKVSSINCPWRLVIGYSKEEIGWRIESFEFDDAKDVTLKGSRRRYKEKATVPVGRFRIQIPSSAHKITL